MKKSLIYLMLMALVIGAAGCMKENCCCGEDEDPATTLKPAVVFQYEYTNHAWGYRHHGFLIEPDGKVKGFKEPKNWIAPDSLGMMNPADLKNNLAQCDTVYSLTSEWEVESNYRKIRDIRNGKIQDDGTVMADAGTGMLSAWYWNEKAGKFENVLLITNGDLSSVNTHPSARAVIDWLKSVGEKTDRFYWYGK